MKTRSLILLIILLLPVIITPAYTQTHNDSLLEIELSSIYGFKGEILNITIHSSFFENARLIIINPEEKTLLNATRPTNTLIQYSLSSGLIYGVYKIIVYKSGHLQERFFTLIDTEDYAIVNFPHQVFHKGLVYNFYANYTLTIENNKDKMSINFNLLKYLALNYHITVKAFSNNMTFLVSFTKLSNIKITLLFMFIHRGCKIFINGTLDKARDFTFSLDKIKNVYSGSAYSGNICFDFKDTVYSYSVIRNKVIVHIPKDFSFGGNNPIVFSSGFEDLILNEWDSKTEYEVASVDTTRTDLTKAYGNYSLNVTIITDATGNQIGNVKKDIGYKEDLIYVRTYFKISTLPKENDDLWDFIEYYYLSAGRGGCGLYNNSGNLYFGITVYNATSTSWETYFSSSVNYLLTDWWYCLQLMIDYDTGDINSGETRLWLNGTLLINATGLNNYHGTSNPDIIAVGCEIPTPEQEYNIFHDSVKVDLTEYIPCEVTPPEENEEEEEPEEPEEPSEPETFNQIDVVFFVLNIFLIVLAIISIVNSKVFIITLCLSCVMISSVILYNTTFFIVTLTLISSFITLCLGIMGIVKDRGI